MIRLNNISKVFNASQKKVNALNNVDLHVEQGEFVVIKGPSGSGKTTLLLTIGTMLKPTTGSVKINNENIYRLSRSERSAFRAVHMGFVFQEFHLIPYLSILDNIMLSAGLVNNKESALRAAELPEKLGLSDRMLHKPSELSGGEQQRVALARAIVHQPEIILADEFTGNLDPDNSSVVVHTLKAYQQSGGTVLACTHRQDADHCADRILHLNNGKIVG